MRTDNSAFKITKFADSTFEFDHLTLLFESNSMRHNLRFESHLVSQAKSLKSCKRSKKRSTNFTSSN